MSFFKNRWIKATFLISLPFVVFVAAYFYMEKSAAWELDRLLEDARNKGEAVSMMEINQKFGKYHLDPEAKKEWKRILKELRKHEQKTFSVQQKFRVDSQEKLAELSIDKLDRLISPIEMEIQSAIQLLKEHDYSPLFFVNISNTNPLENHATSLASEQGLLAKFLNWKSTLAVKEGKIDEAVANWKIAILLETKVLETDLMDIETSAQFCLNRFVYKPIVYWTKKNKLKPNHLSEIQNKLIYPKSATSSSIDELVAVRAMFFDQRLFESLSGAHGSKETRLFPETDRLWRFRVLSIPIKKISNSWKESADRVSISAKEALAEKGYLEQTIIPSRRIIDERNLITAPFFYKTFCETENRSFLIYLAAARYTLINKRPPDSLEQLVPEFLHNVPLDPYSDKPFHYNVDKNNFKIWSVGENRLNDGGDIEQPDSSSDFLDVGFAYEREVIE